MKRLTIVLLLIILICSLGCSNLGVANSGNNNSSSSEKTLTILVGNNNGGSGKVDPDYGSHQYKTRQEVIVTATPQPGSLFFGWQGIEGIMSKMSAIDTSKPSSWLDYKIDIRMDRDVILTPIFYRAFNLNISVNGLGSVRINKVQGMGQFDANRFVGDITQNTPGGHIYCDGEYVTFDVVPEVPFLPDGHGLVISGRLTLNI